MEYWKRKAEDSRTKSKEFYKAILDTKVSGTDSRFVNLEENGIYERNQATVANHFASYFSSVAMDIVDPNLLTSTEEQLEDTPSVQGISQQQEILIAWRKKIYWNDSGFNYHHLSLHI